jgi:hypothetical protein
MPVPHPTDGNLYVKLRDDPSVVNSTALGAQQLPASSDEAARAPERHAAHAEPEAALKPVPPATAEQAPTTVPTAAVQPSQPASAN